MRRLSLAALLILGLALLAPPSTAAVAQLTLDPPVSGSVTARFDMPSRYGAGHRGVDIAVPVGTTATASAHGQVTFAGSVVGARWVTVDHGPVRTTVGPLSHVEVRVGQQVARGDPLGATGTAHGHAALHWSARVGDRYVDPLRWQVLVATLIRPG